MMSNTYINFGKRNIISTLVRFNFQWYQQVMRDILFRYKIFLLFIVATLVSTLANIFHLIIFPVEGFLSYPIDSVSGLIISFILYQVFSLVWIKLHQLVVTNQPWKSYILSLQISNAQKLLIDVSLLSIINVILWISLLFYVFEKISKTGFMNLEFLLVISKCALVMTLILLIQLSWINKKSMLLVPVLLINSVIIPSMIYLNPGFQIASIMALVVVALYFIAFSYMEVYASFRNRVLDNKRSVYKHNKYQPFPFIRVQLKNLWENTSQLSMVLSILVVMDFVAVAMILYGSINPLLPFILSVIVMINALSISNLFKRMSVQWSKYAGFVNSLPVAKLKLFAVNYTIAGFLSLICNSIILILASLLGVCSIYKLIPSLIISIIFLVVTYLPQIKMDRYGFFVSLCLMIGFSYCNYLLITILG